MSDMVMHPLAEIREWDEALAVLGIQDSDQTPADAIRELNARIEALEAALRHCLDELEDSHGFNRLRAVISAALLTEQDK